MIYNMQIHHALFIVLKTCFLVIYLLVKFNILPAEPRIEFIIEDLLKLLVIIATLYIFSPFRKKFTIHKHDRYFAFCAAFFLLASFKLLNKLTFWKEIKDTLKMHTPWHTTT